MIKKIYQAQHDVDELSSRKMPETGEYFDYRNIIVNKPWGYEYLMFENEHVAIWVLYLKDGAKTSMHCHPKKKTSLLVLEGAVNTSSLLEAHDLCARDCVMIDKGTFHSTCATHPTGSFIMEIESPPEKSDLVRLKDEYGRENKGYEGRNEMTRDLDQYEHHTFHDILDEERSLIEKVIKQSRIVLHHRENWQSLLEEVKAKEFCLVSFLDTSLRDQSGEEVLAAGDLCERDWLLSEYDNLKTDKESFTVLSIY